VLAMECQSFRLQHAMHAMYAAHRDVSVLVVGPGGAHLKRFKCADLDEARVSNSVQQGHMRAPLATTTHHLLCMRRILQVSQPMHAVLISWFGWSALCIIRVKVYCLKLWVAANSSSSQPWLHACRFLQR
jgi:hypothetical protein